MKLSNRLSILLATVIIATTGYTLVADLYLKGLVPLFCVTILALALAVLSSRLKAVSQPPKHDKTYPRGESEESRESTETSPVENLEAVHNGFNTPVDTIKENNNILNTKGDESELLKDEPESEVKGRQIEGFSEFKNIYRILFDSYLDGVCLVNSDGYVELVNPALADMMGSAPHKLVGISIYEFIVEDDISILQKHFQDNLEGKNTTESYHVRAAKKNSERMILELSGAPTKINGSPAVIILARDITSHVEMETQLQQSERLKNLGVLATGIAHEFNNLLVGIVGYVSFIKMKDLDDNIKRHIDVIESSAQKAANLSRQLLTFGRPYIKDTRIFEVRDLIDAVMELLKGTFPKHAVLITDIHPDNMFLDADINQLHQVLMNLCLNAKDAIKEGGEIVISVQPVTLNDRYCKKSEQCKPGKYICISVSDTGIGMDEETKRKIFDPFFTTKEVGESSGLGLSTVYGIVNGHKGFIDVTSEPGKGARFDFYLPASKEEIHSFNEKASVEAHKQEETCSGSGSTILIIDDETTVREFLVECLDMIGYSTRTASSAHKALEIYSQKPNDIDLVITDMAMPEMNGVELANKLYEMDPNVRIILSSGFDTEHITHNMPPVIVDFIQKPYKISHLSATLEKALDTAGHS